MPLFHSNAIMAGWAPAVAGRASIALRRKFSASQFFPDVRRVGATYANYVGKPLSYILATPERDDDADNPLRIAYGNEGAPRDLSRFAQRFAVEVVDGFGSSEGGVAIARTPDTPEGALGPLVGGVTIVDVDTGPNVLPGWSASSSTPPGPVSSAVITTIPTPTPTGCAAASTTVATSPIETTMASPISAGRLGDWLRVDGENLGTAPIERILMRYPGVTEAVVYAIPDEAVGDRVMAALVLPDPTAFQPRRSLDSSAPRMIWGQSSGRPTFESPPHCRAPRPSR